jgi:DNA-binding SARP family transcriptional activator
VDIEVHAFGPMEISHHGAGLPVSHLQQVLLAMLLVRRGGVVSVSALAEALWPVRPPVTVGKSLQIHVYRLRRALGHPGALRHRPPGYALAMPAASVDLYRFEELAQRGRAALVSGDPMAAADLLRQATALHRGPAFQGLDQVHELAIESQRLAELRLAALEDRVAADLALNGSGGLVPELEALVAEHPLRERFRAQLMTALHRAGRRADALAAYQRGRQALADELGVEPSQECRALARAIRAGDPGLLPPPESRPSGGGGSGAGPPGARVAAGSAPAPAGRPSGGGAGPPVAVPRQLPADVPGFTGRARELRRLTAQLRRWDAQLSRWDPPHPAAGQPAARLVCAVEGTAGVGKTALAVRWAHRVADRFADGQLYVDLRGYAAGPPVAPIQALSGFLRALGLAADQIPSDLAEAAAAYRSLLADRRVLVLLDNAAGAEQVRPLLPGGSGCVVLVTSRDQLAGLAARDGAQRLALDVLPAGEARALLARTLGGHRVKAEPEAVTELVELCGRLPLALRIAAANLTGGQRCAIADYLAQIRGRDRLAVLAVAGDEQAAVAGAFDQSYRRLPEPARRMFRLLGLLAGPDVTAGAAAALAGAGPAALAGTGTGGDELAVLAGAHLVEEHRPGRYTCHDLLRAYARDRVNGEETAADRRAALARLHAYYVRTAGAAGELLYPHALRLPPAAAPPRTPAPPDAFPDPAGAVRWLDAELPNLLAAARQAAADGAGETVWRLADALRTFLLHRGHPADAEALAEAGLLAAAAAGERQAYGCALLGRAGLHYRQGRGRAAIGDLTRALAAFRETGWLAGQGAALANLGSVHSQQGQPSDAVGYYTEALAVYERIGSRIWQAGVIGNLGVVLLELGRLREAAEQVRRAGTGMAGLGADQFEALNLGTLGEVQRLLGELGPAQRAYAQAQARYRAIGDRTGEGSALLGLAEVHCDLGQPEPARELAEAALQIARDTEHIGHEASALAVLSQFHLRYGAPEHAQAAGRRALALARQTGDRHLEVEVLVGLARVPSPAGTGGVDQALEIARAAGFRLLEGLALARSAALRLAAGDLPRAVSDGEQALAIQQEIGHRLGAARTHLVLSQARRRAGDAEAGRNHQERARQLLTGLGVRDPGAAGRQHR